MTRHIGAFIQNTVKPCIETLDNLLGECKHLGLNRKDVFSMLRTWAVIEIFKSILYAVVVINVCYVSTLIVYWMIK